jgi:hypothetical protein
MTFKGFFADDSVLGYEVEGGFDRSFVGTYIKDGGLLAAHTEV